MASRGGHFEWMYIYMYYIKYIRSGWLMSWRFFKMCQNPCLLYSIVGGKLQLRRFEWSDGLEADQGTAL